MKKTDKQINSYLSVLYFDYFFSSLGIIFFFLAYHLLGDDMESKEAIINNYNHSITITERKNLLITGVKKIENFDSEEFLLETVMGFLVVKGEELELVKLDTLAGNVSIKGLIKGFSYMDDNNKKVKENNSVFNRLFK